MASFLSLLSSALSSSCLAKGWKKDFFCYGQELVDRAWHCLVGSLPFRPPFGLIRSIFGPLSLCPSMGTMTLRVVEYPSSFYPPWASLSTRGVP